MSTLDQGALGALPDPVDLPEVAAADLLIDQIARRNPPPGDQLAADLAGLLDLLDDELGGLPRVRALDRTASAPVDRQVARQAQTSISTWARGRSGRRRLCVAAAVSVVAMAGTGVAAAAPGSFLYPAHRVIFGATPSDQPLLAEATQALDQAQAIIVTGKSKHGLSTGDQATARVLLERAHGLIAKAPDSATRTALLGRWQQLSGTLSGLELATPSPAAKHPQPRSTAVASPAPSASTQSSRGDQNRTGGTATDEGGSTDSGSSNGSRSDGNGGSGDGKDSGNPTSPPSDTSGNGGSSSGGQS